MRKRAREEKVHHETRAMGGEFIMRKNDGVRVHDEKKSNGVRVHDEEKSDGVRVNHEKKSDRVGVHHKKERWGETSP